MMKRSLVACLIACAGAAGAASPKAPAFFARRDYLGAENSWVQVADTNGDGIPDLITNRQFCLEMATVPFDRVPHHAPEFRRSPRLLRLT
jgi:hypothetical protein